MMPVSFIISNDILSAFTVTCPIFQRSVGNDDESLHLRLLLL